MTGPFLNKAVVRLDGTAMGALTETARWLEEAGADGLAVPGIWPEVLHALREAVALPLEVHSSESDLSARAEAALAATEVGWFVSANALSVATRDRLRAAGINMAYSLATEPPPDAARIHAEDPAAAGLAAWAGMAERSVDWPRPAPEADTPQAEIRILPFEALDPLDPATTLIQARR